MFNCIKSFSYKMNISANQVSNALRMKALGNTKPDTPKIAGNFFANKFTIHLSKNHPFGGPDNQSPDFDGTVENSANGSVLTLKMKSKPPVQRVVFSRAISPCYRPAPFSGV